MLEIERKYLLKPSVLDMLHRIPHSCKELEQFYTRVTEAKSVRYRRAGKHYYKTVKKGIGAIREEREKEISEKRYMKKRRKHLGVVIAKKRCLFEIDGLEYSIDIFKKPYDGLLLLEVEFASEAAYKRFRLPEVLQPHVEREATEEGTYVNKNLALFGLPLDEEDPQRSDRVVIGKLRKLAEKTLFYLQKAVRGNDDEDLHQLRVSVRNAVALLDGFAFLWREEAGERYRPLLKEIISITNAKRDLDVMTQRLSALEQEKREHLDMDAFLALKKELATMRERERRYIKAYLQSSQLRENLLRYGAFVDSGYREMRSAYAAYAIGPVVSYVIYRQFEKIRKLAVKIDWEEDVEKIHKLRIGCKKLRYTLENFEEHFDAAHLSPVVKDLKKLQTKLGAFHDYHQEQLLFAGLMKREKDPDILLLLQREIVPALQRSQHKLRGEIRQRTQTFLKDEDRIRQLFIAPRVSEK